MEEKLNALLNDQEFTDKVSECKDAADLKTLLAEYGIEITSEQAEAIFTCDPDNLDDETLAAVAGGVGARAINGLMTTMLKCLIKYLRHPGKIGDDFKKAINGGKK